MISHAATIYRTELYCAAFRKGVLTVVRRRDGHSCTLSVSETNMFRQRLDAFEDAPDERDPIDRACARHVVHMKNRKWVVVEKNGEVITFHPEPVGMTCPT